MSVDTWRKVIAAVSLIGLVAVVLALSQSDRTSKPMNINGDMLGQDVSETLGDYRDRAAESLAEAPSDQAAFGLITFTEPSTPAEAAVMLTELRRVNAMVMLSAAPMEIPEPVVGETREDVFNREIDRVDHSLAGIGEITAPREIDAVVAWDNGDAFRSISGEDSVLAVEVLPADASWGRFGVRPVGLVDG
ncbi:hypothetical protein [Corynebacterium sp. A21]|uniref:hypothetical protein n=1 Tax=Corynebacterium sp. A21 TaxID=3457318 RepID=UPI003FCF5E12